MKIVVEKDDGERVEFRNVTDAYLCVRQLEPMGSREKGAALLPETRSWSWGNSGLRELVKELAQSLEELRDVLRGALHGNGSRS